MEVVAKKAIFQKYPAYKDSGEYWMGAIPEHWEIRKLKHVFKEKKKVTNPSLNCGSISFGKVIYKDDEKVPESTKASYQEVLAGEYLVNPLNLNYDLISLRIGLSDINVVVSSGYIVLKNAIELDKSYFNYLLHRYDVAYMKLLGSGVRQTISFNHIANSLLAYPPKEEQTAIANFLDDKTAKIDRAIAQKEKMIALLKERKQIIIQNAVTRGLDPNAKMKDSGVEWIGEIPEHWEVKKLKFLLKIRNGQEYKHVVSDEGFPVIGSGGAFAFATDYLYDGEALLLGRKGTIDKPLYVNEKFWTVDTMFYAIVNNAYSTRYLYFLALTIPFKFYSTSTALPSMTQDDLNNHKVAVPDLKEQIAILNFLDIELGKFDRSIALQQTQIEKLKEYKATLIDSVVTGKIKVC